MATEAGRAVALEVQEVIGRGEIPNVSKIAPKHGYSPSTARSGEVQKTKSYKDAMAPLIQKLERERNRAIAMMAGKIGKAKYRDLTDSVDKLTKTLQLLQGRSTENHVVVHISQEAASKYDVPTA